MSRRVVRVPHQHTRHGAVHAHGHEARHAEADAGRLDMGDCGVAGDGDGEHDEHGKATELDAIRDEGHGHLAAGVTCQHLFTQVRDLIGKEKKRKEKGAMKKRKEKNTHR